MKKMFVAGMNETKAYVEPKMMVIEVDAACLCDPSGSTEDKDQENKVDNIEDDVVDDGVFTAKYWKWGF